MTNEWPCCVATYSVGFHQVGGLIGQALFLLNVVSNVAKLLLQHAHSLKVGRVVEGVAPQEQQLIGWRRQPKVNAVCQTMACSVEHLASFCHEKLPRLEVIIFT